VVTVSPSARLTLFVSSYAPLLGVFALHDSQAQGRRPRRPFGKGAPTILRMGLAALGVPVIPFVLLWARRLAPQRLQAASCQIRDGDAIAYIATYLVPFAAVTATTARERAALGLFVLLIAIIYIRSELFYINPLIAVAGYRLFQVVMPANASVVLITKRAFLPSGHEVSARRLGDYV
jgi:hypothetical protein